MQRPADSRLTEPVAAKPARKRVGSKGAPPPQGDTLGALNAEAPPSAVKPKYRKEKPAKAPTADRTEPLNFRVTPEFRRAFKRAAAAQDCKKVELLERVFNEWSTRNPG